MGRHRCAKWRCWCSPEAVRSVLWGHSDSIYPLCCISLKCISMVGSGKRIWCRSLHPESWVNRIIWSTELPTWDICPQAHYHCPGTLWIPLLWGTTVLCNFPLWSSPDKHWVMSTWCWLLVFSILPSSLILFRFNDLNGSLSTWDILFYDFDQCNMYNEFGGLVSFCYTYAQRSWY